MFFQVSDSRQALRFPQISRTSLKQIRKSSMMCSMEFRLPYPRLPQPRMCLVLLLLYHHVYRPLLPPAVHSQKALLRHLITGLRMHVTCRSDSPPQTYPPAVLKAGYGMTGAHAYVRIFRVALYFGIPRFSHHQASLARIPCLGSLWTSFTFSHIFDVPTYKTNSCSKLHLLPWHI